MATYKSVKVTEFLQSPETHKELLGDGQQLKRQTSRSRSASQQSQGVFNQTGECLHCEADTLCGAALPDSAPWMSYCPLAAHTQQYYSEDKDAVVPPWTLNVGLGTSSSYSIQGCETQLISMS